MTFRSLPLLAGLGLTAGFSATLSAEVVMRQVPFRLEGQGHVSVVVRPATVPDGGLPGLLMVPNWMGVTEAAVAKATRIAAMGYVVYVADLYTAAVRPAGPGEAGQVAGALRGNRDLMRMRMQAAWDHFKSLEAESGVAPGRYAAIGFCFGGGAVLEFARTGAELAAVVSFHGDLLSPTLAEDSAAIRARVLVLHGAADPYVPPAHVAEWEAVMGKTEADWQLVSFGGAVHSFTDPLANNPGQAMYDAKTATRAFKLMRLWLDEAFQP